MSIKAFEAVIGKAMLETWFRNLLLADPDQALAGYDLTGEEMALLKKIDCETLDSLGGTLETLINKYRSRVSERSHA